MVGDLAGGEGVDLGQQLGVTDGCLYGGAWSHLAQDQLVVFQTNNCDPPNSSAITSVDIGGSTPSAELIYRDKGIFALDISPDGAEIVFDRLDKNSAAQGLWLVGSDGQSEPRQLTDEGAQPAWRP